MGVQNVDNRRDKRINKQKESKEYLSIYREFNRLNSAKRSHELVELPKPVRKGWKRFFVLRPDIAKSRESDFFRGLLKLVNTTVYSRNKDFLTKDWKTKKMKPITQGIKGLDAKEYNKLTPKQKSFFIETLREDKFRKKWYPHFIIEDSWRFVYKVEPHYVTHSFVIYPELESQLAKLRNKMDSQLLWAKICKAMSRKFGYDRDIMTPKSWLMEKSIDAETRKTLIECEDYFAE